jgi:hypothetical protein
VYFAEIKWFREHFEATKYVYMYICMYVRMCVRTYVCTRMYVCMYVYMIIWAQKCLCCMRDSNLSFQRTHALHYATRANLFKESTCVIYYECYMRTANAAERACYIYTWFVHADCSVLGSITQNLPRILVMLIHLKKNFFWKNIDYRNNGNNLVRIESDTWILDEISGKE